jgi:protein-tyrosine phosphatase
MVELCPANVKDKKVIKLMMDYSKKWQGHDVPDPYYGGSKGFEHVLDMLEEACEELLLSLKK